MKKQGLKLWVAELGSSGSPVGAFIYSDSAVFAFAGTRVKDANPQLKWRQFQFKKLLNLVNYATYNQ